MRETASFFALNELPFKPLIYSLSIDCSQTGSSLTLSASVLNCADFTALPTLQLCNVSSAFTFDSPPRTLHRIVLGLARLSNARNFLAQFFDAINLDTTRCTVVSADLLQNGINADFAASFPRVTFISYAPAPGSSPNFIVDFPCPNDIRRSIGYQTCALNRDIQRQYLMRMVLHQESGTLGRRWRGNFDLTRYTQLTLLSISKVFLFPRSLRELYLDNVRKPGPLQCSSITKLYLRDCSVNVASLHNLRSLTLEGKIDIAGSQGRLSRLHRFAA